MGRATYALLAGYAGHSNLVDWLRAILDFNKQLSASEVECWPEAQNDQTRRSQAVPQNADLTFEPIGRGLRHHPHALSG